MPVRYAVPTYRPAQKTPSRRIRLPLPVVPTDAYGLAVYPDSPATWYRIDEGSGTVIADNWKRWPDGSLVGTPTWSTALVTGGTSSIDLNGTTQYASIPDSLGLKPFPITFEAWAAVDTLPASTAIVGRKDNQYFIQVNSDGSVEFGVWNQAGTLYNDISAAGTVAAAGTYYFALVWNGSSFEGWVGPSTGSLARVVFINGAATGTGLQAATTPLRLGTYDTTSLFLDGRVDEAAVYGSALSAFGGVASAPRLQAHFDAGKVTGGADVNVTAATGTATAAGGTSTLAFTWTSATGAATATGGTVTKTTVHTAATGVATAGGGTSTLSVTLTAATGTATASGAASIFTDRLTATAGTATGSGGTVTLAVTLLASTGTSTAGGGTVNALQGVFVSVTTGTASAAGTSSTLAFTWLAATGTATATGANASRGATTFIAATGTATAAGGTILLTVTLTAITGAGTAGGGTATASIVGGGLTATNGAATATGGTLVFIPRWTATTGIATATGGSVNRVNTVTGGVATASGSTTAISWLLPALTGTAAGTGGTVALTVFVPTLGNVDGTSSLSAINDAASRLAGVDDASRMIGEDGTTDSSGRIEAAGALVGVG